MSPKTLLAATALAAASMVAAATDRPEEPSLDCLIEPHLVIALSTRAEGVLEHVYVDRGDLVEAGQVVAMLESGVERAVVDLASARAQLSADIGASRVGHEYGLRKGARYADLDRDEVQTEAALAAFKVQKALEDRRIAELQLRQALETLKLRTLTSPVRGVVLDRLLSPGESVEDRAILRIAQIDPLNVEVLVPVAQHGKVRPGMLGLVEPEAPVGGLYEARVTVVDRVMDAASGTFRVRLELPNPEYRLPAGLKCQVRLRPAPPGAPEGAPVPTAPAQGAPSPDSPPIPLEVAPPAGTQPLPVQGVPPAETAPPSLQAAPAPADDKPAPLETASRPAEPPAPRPTGRSDPSPSLVAVSAPARPGSTVDLPRLARESELAGEAPAALAGAPTTVVGASLLAKDTGSPPAPGGSGLTRGGPPSPVQVSPLRDARGSELAREAPADESALLAKAEAFLNGGSSSRETEPAREPPAAVVEASLLAKAPDPAPGPGATSLPQGESPPSAPPVADDAGPAAQAAPAGAKPLASAARSTACAALGPFATAPQARQLARALEGDGLEVALREHTVPTLRDHMVHIPRRQDPQAAQALARTLREQGVKDLWVVPNGPHAGTISLGVFGPRANAERYQLELARRGVHSRVTPRFVERAAYWLDVRLPADQVALGGLRHRAAAAGVPADLAPATCPPTLVAARP